MALLKSLIQRLLDSRTTPEEAGHSAMPSATKTTFLSKDEAVGSWGHSMLERHPLMDIYLSMLVPRTARTAKSEHNLAIFSMCLHKHQHLRVWASQYP